jgi:hypothetical protein
MPIPIPSPWRGGGLNWLVQRFPNPATNSGPPIMVSSSATPRTLSPTHPQTSGLFAHPKLLDSHSHTAAMQRLSIDSHRQR